MVRRLPLVGALLLFPIALLTPAASAPTGRIIHVDCTDTTGVEDGSEVYPYDTIQEGIDAAVDGDTVLVHPCTYHENIDFLGKAITVTSVDPWDSAIVESTVIDAGGAGTVVTFADGEREDSMLSGFTVTNGSGSKGGGGIYCSRASPTIINNLIHGNRASTRSGGGIYCYACWPVISSNSVTDNNADDGGGIYCDGWVAAPNITGNYVANNRAVKRGGGIGCHYSRPTITNNCLIGNTADLGGGGVSCEQAWPVIAGNTITGNTANNWGGGIDCYLSEATITGNTITENATFYNGGGIFCLLGSAAIVGNTLIANTAADGGGIECDGPFLGTIANNTIARNTATDFGGGIHLYKQASPIIAHNVITGNGGAKYGGGIYCDYASSPAIGGNTISGNSSIRGAGIDCRNESSPSIAADIISFNQASYAGGGIRCEERSSPVISNSIVVGNSAPSGGGLACYRYCSPAIAGSSLANNEAAEGGAIYCEYSSSPFVCDSIVWDPIWVAADSSISVTYSDTRNPWPGVGNMSVDPQFVDPANGDYHLLPTSPYIDTGTNDCMAPDDVDIDGEPRIWPPWGRVDMGADEVVCYCDLAIDRTHCKMPAAGHVGQCKTGQIGARNMSFTEPCDVVMRVTDNAGVVVFESQPTTIGPGQRLRLRFNHCYTADEVGRNLWTWELWPAECEELTPWNNVHLRRVNVQPGARSAISD